MSDLIINHTVYIWHYDNELYLLKRLIVLHHVDILKRDCFYSLYSRARTFPLHPYISVRACSSIFYNINNVEKIL